MNIRNVFNTWYNKIYIKCQDEPYYLLGGQIVGVCASKKSFKKYAHQEDNYLIILSIL